MTATLIAFVCYSLAVLGIGLWATRKPQHTAEEIHLGNREHGTWTSALSTSASTESGFVLLGMVGMSFSEGLSVFWMVPAGILGYALNWLVLAPKLREKSARLNAVTVPEYLALSTGATGVSRIASAAASVCALVFLIAYVSAQFCAAGKALSSQFPVSYAAGVVLAAALICLYAVLGGFRAVSWTDNLQAVMMIFALIVLPAVILVDIGGPGALVSTLRAKDPDLVRIFGGSGNAKAGSFLVLSWLMIGLGYPGQPHGIARLMAVRDREVFRFAPLIAMVWMSVIYTGAILLGMAARASFGHVGTISSDPETALPVLAVEILPGLLAGVTLAAIIAAISSTADSQLLTASSTVIRDIRSALRLKPLRNELLATRIVIVVLTALSAYFALRRIHMVFRFVLYAFFGLGATLGPAMLYCTLVDRPRPVPVLAGVVTGLVFTFALQGHPIHFVITFFVTVGAVALAHGIAVVAGRGSRD